ncbi:MAG TPA: methyltransferase domain-containing protein [Pyrinomonadaceae bacterium]|nr:methyltransferase domain-containing protein [Pyrinomonadaceae bacterium]
MPNSTERFTSRVETYAKFRPGYPPDVLELLRSECGLTPDTIVADVGSGTGILSELLLKNGNEVLGVEPNNAMREAAEHLLRNYPSFKSVGGSAESTTLPDQSVELITAGQAFHWFDGAAARREFSRILKPQGYVALIWNDRRLDSTPFLRGYEALLRKYGTDYAKVQEFNPRDQIADFFAPQKFKLREFSNRQAFDFEGFKGRVMSASYTPEPNNPNFEPMLEALLELYNSNQVNGTVAFEYDTKIYYGKLA